MKLISPVSMLALALTISNQSYAFELPVEVLGEEGKTVARSLNLTAEQAGAAQIWLQVNNLSYENKASVQVNSGDWYDLNHNSATIAGPELARGGMVHGGFNTIRLTIPAQQLQSGDNTINFRFNHSDGISNGYRVVKFNLLDANGNKLLADDFFTHDDPNSWEPPYADANSIAEGMDLWYNGQLVSNYLTQDRKGFWYAYELSPGQEIKATCSSCHTQDGRDLELFAYSNDAIIERAKFHHLSEEEGKKIASYIRSLSTTYDNVNRHGRPWNPPYQPGPGLDTLPIEYWAAGAGLDAVLENDADMLPYLFPNGVDQEKVYDRFDSDKSFDRTLIPLAIQFPDWKHWLPMVHPMDAYNKNNYYLDPNTGPNNPHKDYQEVRTYLEQQAPQGFPNKQELANKIHVLHNHHRFFVEQGGTNKDHWRTSDGYATQNLFDDVPRELAATSLARLFAVKNFEFVQEFDLQDKAHEFGDPSDQFQPRQWPGNEYNVFEVPPHFQACVDNNCNQFNGQPTATGMYESTNWYQLQMVINGGDGNMSWNSPVDYNYHPDFITKASNSSGVPEPLRYYHSMNVMYQTKTWSGGDSPNSGVGFRIRVMGPWNIYGITDGNQFNGYEPGEFASYLDSVQPGLTPWVLNAMLRQFLTEVNKDHNRLEIWNRTEDGDDNTLDRADKTYADIEDALIRTTRKETFFWHYAAKFYYYIPRFQALGVDCEIMEEVIDWCQEAWPLIDWHVFSYEGGGDCHTAMQIDGETAPGGELVHIIKEGTPSYGVDGENGGSEYQRIKLWGDNPNNVNQQWVEVDRGGGYYSYRKQDTEVCWDGGVDGANGQLIYTRTCDENNHDQHWRKVEIRENVYRLEKRNAPGYSIDGGAGSENGQQLKLWNSDDNNVNQHWRFEPFNQLITGLVLQPGLDVDLAYPNPFVSTVELTFPSGVTSAAVFDITGKLVEEVSKVATAVGGDWQPGSYLVVFDNGQASRVVKR